MRSDEVIDGISYGVFLCRAVVLLYIPDKTARKAKRRLQRGKVEDLRHPIPLLKYRGSGRTPMEEELQVVDSTLASTSNCIRS